MERDPSINVKERGIFRGWIVAGCCFCMTLTFGIAYSYSDFFIPLAKEFGWNHAVDSAVPAASLLVFSFGSLAGGYFVSRVGFRRMSFVGALLVGVGTALSSQVNGFYELLLTFGMMAALGSSLVVVSGTSLVVKWFVKKRGLAVGIMVSGSGFGTLVIPPMAEYLMGNGTDWRKAFLVIGICFLILLLTASFFMQTPEDLSQKPYGWHDMSQEERNKLRDFTLKEAAHTSSFWMIYLMFFLGTVGATVFLAEAAPFASTYGIGAVVAATALSVFGAGSILSRLLVGALSDRISRRSALVASFLPELVALAALPFVASSIPFFFIAAFAIGFGYGGFLSSFIALTGDLFGMKWTQRMWGVQETAYGLGGLIGPIAAGLYFDAFNTYTGIIEVSALGVLFALILSIALPGKINKLSLNQTT